MRAAALATPDPAQTRDPTLADSQEPGSYIVFPKFVNAPAVSVDGAMLPRTEIEIGVVNPPHTGVVLPEHTTIKVRFHFAPGISRSPVSSSVASKFVCREVDFDVFLSINGKLALSADGTPINSNSPRVPAAPCKNGYLVAWVIDNDRLVKFDGLIGDAVIRGPAINGSATPPQTAAENGATVTPGTPSAAQSGPPDDSKPFITQRDIDRTVNRGEHLYRQITCPECGTIMQMRR